MYPQHASEDSFTPLALYLNISHNMILDVIQGARRDNLFIVVSQIGTFYFIFTGWER